MRIMNLLIFLIFILNTDNLIYIGITSYNVYLLVN